MGLFALRSNVDSKDEKGVEALLPNAKIEITYGEDGAQRMILNGEDVSKDIRLPDVSLYASNVSAMPAVRAFLLDMQREFARKHNVVMDGRDIGTVVLPNAGIKIFLTATDEERALRRYTELKEKGMDVTLYDVFKDIQYRDHNDSSRKTAPLKIADDAVVVDTTGKSLEESFDIICEIIKERFGI